jgi:hypothetical protein
LTDWYFPLEDEADTVSCKVLLRKFRFDELLNVRGKVLWQDGVCAARIEAQGKGKNFAVARTYPVLSVLTVREVMDRVGSMRIGMRAG